MIRQLYEKIVQQKRVKPELKQSGLTWYAYCPSDSCKAQNICITSVSSYFMDGNYQFCSRCGIGLDISELKAKSEELKTAQTVSYEVTKDAKIRALEEENKKLKAELKEKNNKKKLWNDVLGK